MKMQGLEYDQLVVCCGEPIMSYLTVQGANEAFLRLNDRTYCGIVPVARETAWATLARMGKPYGVDISDHRPFIQAMRELLETSPDEERHMELLETIAYWLPIVAVRDWKALALGYLRRLGWEDEEALETPGAQETLANKWEAMEEPEFLRLSEKVT